MPTVCILSIWGQESMVAPCALTQCISALRTWDYHDFQKAPEISVTGRIWKFSSTSSTVLGKVPEESASIDRLAAMQKRGSAECEWKQNQASDQNAVKFVIYIDNNNNSNNNNILYIYAVCNFVLSFSFYLWKADFGLRSNQAIPICSPPAKSWQPWRCWSTPQAARWRESTSWWGPCCTFSVFSVCHLFAFNT